MLFCLRWGRDDSWSNVTALQTTLGLGSVWNVCTGAFLLHSFCMFWALLLNRLYLTMSRDSKLTGDPSQSTYFLIVFISLLTSCAIFIGLTKVAVNLLHFTVRVLLLLCPPLIYPSCMCVDPGVKSLLGAGPFRRFGSLCNPSGPEKPPVYNMSCHCLL